MTKARRDLFTDGTTAHTSLKGQVAAAHFTDGEVFRVAQSVADLSAHPDGSPERQVLYGHPVRQLDGSQGLSRDETSQYVGYICEEAIAPWTEPTHRVSARASYLFSEPDFKAPRPLALSLGSLLRIEESYGKYACTSDGRFAIVDHLSPIETPVPDLAATADKLLGTPYLWAGNSAFGIDCSGLVQITCQAAHRPCPGDSDQQLLALGSTLAPGTPPQRNDLMFWKGHVALVFDDSTLIHANAHHMAVEQEPIAEALHRIQAQGDGPLLAHKRFL